MMQNIKRRYVYSVLALPFIAFGVYTATLSPLNRGTFFSEFKHKTVILFTGEPDAAPEGNSASGDSVGGAAPEGGGGRGGGPGGGRRGGGRFDPAAIFANRDADGDGQLTGDEISDRMRENIDLIDADQDGSVTLEEFQAGIQQMFSNRGAGDDGPGGLGSDRGSGESESDPGEVTSDRSQRHESE